MKKNILARFLGLSIYMALAMVVLVGCFAMPSFAQAATLYWTGNIDGANTNVATNWSTLAVACTASGNGTVPTNADTLVFTSSCTNGATFNASLTASTGQISIQSGYTGSIMGANNITYANPVDLHAGVTVFVDTGNTFTLSGIIDDSGAGYKVTKTGAGTLTLSGANTFGGGLTIKAGTVRGQTSTSAFGGSGTGVITLGDSSGSADASLSNYYLSFANPITVASGSSANTLTVTGATTGANTYTGAITLNNNLTITAPASCTINLSGGITGTGNVILNNTGTTSNFYISGSPINMTGTLTNQGTATGGTTIVSVIGSNVTGVIQNSSTSQLTLSGANTFTSGLYIMKGTVRGATDAKAFGSSIASDSITLGCKTADSASCGTADATLMGGDSLTFANPITVASGSNGILSINQYSNNGAIFSGLITLYNNLKITNNGSSNLFIINSGITGTGNVTLNQTSSGVLTLSGASINNTGTITNSGTGSGTTTISAVIGTNVTGVIQNSSTSQLTLQGANTWTTGGLWIKKGSVLGSTSTSAFGGSGTGEVIIGDTSGTDNARMLVSTSAANSITVGPLGNTNTGILSIQESSGTPTLSGAITLNHDLAVSNWITYTGGVTGTGNISANINSGAGGVTTFSTNSMNMIGTFTNSGTSSGTTTISAVIGTNVTGILQNSSTSKLVLSGNNSNTGNVTITSGTLELSGTTNLNVGGNFANSGTFTQNQSTVTLTSGTHTISGTNTFYNLTISPSNTVTFPAGVTTTISNAVSLTGTSGHTITLNSSSTGNAATLTTSSALVSGDYLSIRDITPTQQDTWYAGNHSTQVSNTGNWIFTSPPVFWVGGSGNWTDAATHWATTPGGTPNSANLPGSGTSVSFVSSSCGSSCTVTLNSSQQIASLNLNNSNVTISGANTLSLSGTLAQSAGALTVDTVVLNGAGQAVSGNITFNNLTISAPNTVTFAYGSTQTITGTLTAEGSDGNRIVMQSSQAGSAFTFSKTTGTVLVKYCSIKDSTGTGGATWLAPTRYQNIDLTGNTNWAFNSAPEFVTAFGTNGILVSQVSDINSAKFGYVKIEYKTFDSDTNDGAPANVGYITPSFKYKNGGSWTAILSQYLDAGDLDRKSIGSTADGATTYTAYWNVKTALPEIYSTAVQVQVGSDDGETSNHLGTADSATFTVDSKMPVVTVSTLDADANAITLSSSDDNNIYYRVSATALPESILTGPSWTSAGATSVSLVSVPVTVSLTAPTAYLQVKDALGNVVSRTIIAPIALTNFALKDTSNVQSGDYREFLSWTVYSNLTGSSFSRYEIQRAEGLAAGPYSAITNISNMANNYYTDSSVNHTTTYYYKLRIIDSDGDSSAYTPVLNDLPDGQGGSDTTAPTITGVTVSKTQATYVKIAWTTDEPANSTVKYSVHQEGVSPTYDQIATISSYDLTHLVTLSGLLQQTKYDFMVESSDVSENKASDDNNSAGYNFTTILGAEISNIVVTANDTSATVAWNTSKSSDSHVIFAQSAEELTKYMASDETSLAQDIGSNTLVTSVSASSGLYAHRVVISGLAPRTNYYYYVKSTDADSNVILSYNSGNYYMFATTYDVIPPVISAIETPVITSSNVIVTWTTNELSDGQISYGTSSGIYNISTTLDTVLTINHVASIAGLSADTKYYFVIKSADANGNLATSDEQNVSTMEIGQINVNGQVSGVTSTGGGSYSSPSVTLDTTAPIISNVSVVSDQPFGATVTFTTDEPTIGFASYGLSTNYTDVLADLQFGTNHTIKINNLKMGTLYHFLPSASDKSGNLGKSIDTTVTTKFVSEALKDLKSFDNVSQFQEQLQNLIQSILPSLVPPIITNVKVANVTDGTATITWNSNIDTYEGIDYVLAEKYSATADKPYDQQIAQVDKKSTNHSMVITGLLPLTSYHFRVSGYSLPGVVGYSKDLTFATKISKSIAEIGKVGNTNFQVQWRTLQKTNSIVEYVDPITKNIQRVEDSGLVQNHVVSVTDLMPNTTYPVKVFGYDADNNLIEGGSLSVRTTRDIVSPTISNIRINSALLPGQSNLLQTVVSWLTGEPSNSEVQYDEGVSKSETLKLKVTQDGLTTQHILIVPSLKPSTVYRFRIVSRDQAGNIASSPIKTVLTPEKAENIVDVITKNLQESFGFLQKLK